MKVIDNKGSSATVFCELNIGDAFQDTENDICIKTGNDSAICWTDGQWVSYHCYGDDAVLPMEATYIFERNGDGK